MFDVNRRKNLCVDPFTTRGCLIRIGSRGATNSIRRRWIVLPKKRLELIAARERAGLSQRQLGAAVGYEPGSSIIWFFEIGKSTPSLEKARAIARVLGEPVEKLFPTEGDGHAEAS
jgi:DNA-binding XRE family transcriptional regulator